MLEKVHQTCLFQDKLTKWQWHERKESKKKDLMHSKHEIQPFVFLKRQ